EDAHVHAAARLAAVLARPLHAGPAALGDLAVQGRVVVLVAAAHAGTHRALLNRLAVERAHFLPELLLFGRKSEFHSCPPRSAPKGISHQARQPTLSAH